MAEYEIREPEQDAYGDWAAISVGGRYYLFAAFILRMIKFASLGLHPQASMNHSNSAEKLAEGIRIDIGFAEGKFYMITQTAPTM